MLLRHQIYVYRELIALTVKDSNKVSSNLYHERIHLGVVCSKVIERPNSAPDLKE